MASDTMPESRAAAPAGAFLSIGVLCGSASIFRCNCLSSARPFPQTSVQDPNSVRMASGQHLIIDLMPSGQHPVGGCPTGLGRSFGCRVVMDVTPRYVSTALLLTGRGSYPPVVWRPLLRRFPRERVTVGTAAVKATLDGRGLLPT